jgi:pimeloyl-ACP methyl ester carboxylesterase
VRGLRARIAVGVLLVTALVVPVAADERVDITATDGVQLIGRLSGTSGPGVVLVRDPTRESRDAAAAAEALAQRGFRVLRFDLRGHGESEGAVGVRQIERDAEGAFRYLVGRKIRPVYLVAEGASGPPVINVGTRVAAARVVLVGSPAALPSAGGMRVETVPGDLASDAVVDALAAALGGRTGD